MRDKCNNNVCCGYNKVNKINECVDKYHDLKIRPKFFDSIIKGDKTFELRFNDREFRVGEYITLREWVNNDYTKREVTKRITYILEGEHYGLKYRYCILGFK